VRRASAKALAALISSRGDILPVVYAKAVPVLVARFREREEKVQEDVFNTVVEILRQTALLVKHDTTYARRPAVPRCADPRCAAVRATAWPPWCRPLWLRRRGS
jgi:hypothetical protein